MQECLSHPWLNTEELFQRSPVRKSRRSYGSEQSKKRKKIQKLQQQNGVADGKRFTKLFKSAVLGVVNGKCKTLREGETSVFLCETKTF